MLVGDFVPDASCHHSFNDSIIEPCVVLFRFGDFFNLVENTFSVVMSFCPSFVDDSMTAEASRDGISPIMAALPPVSPRLKDFSVWQKSVRSTLSD